MRKKTTTTTTTSTVETCEKNCTYTFISEVKAKFIIVDIAEMCSKFYIIIIYVTNSTPSSCERKLT